MKTHHVSIPMTVALAGLLCLAGCNSNDSEKHHLAWDGFGTRENIQVALTRGHAKPVQVGTSVSVKPAAIPQKANPKAAAVSQAVMKTNTAAPKRPARRTALLLALADPKPAPADAVKSAATRPELPEGTGGFAGSILFDGTPPESKLLYKKGGATKDPAVCGTHAIPDESLIVDAKSKGVKNVFVYLKKKPKGWKGETPKEPVVFDQKGCVFFPHCLVVRAGQTVQVKSGDPIAHNTHTTPFRNAGFNQVVKANDREGLSLVYRKGERLPVPVVCDLHSWMKAYHLVVDHPFAAVTNENGEFAIPGLKPGKYTFTIWHERSGYLIRKLKVTIKAGTYLEESLKFKADKFPAS